MMKRYLLSIILGFVAMTNISFGQVEVNFTDATANTNGTVDIDVTTNGFSNISVLQFSAGWDSLVMTFNSVTFTNPNLPDLVPSNIGTPMGSVNVDEGQFSFSYGNPTGDGNLPDGEVLFTVRFNIVGNECDETMIELTNDPTPIDAFDASFNMLTVTSEPGTVMINGTDCGGGGGDDLTFTAPMVNAEMGTNICIPITVQNFIDIQTGTGTILWDPAVLSYTGLANIALSGLGGSLNETNTDNGELKFIWSNPDPANPVTLDDGSAIFEICFDVIGDIGDMSPITLSTQGSLGFEWGNDDVNELPLVLENGKVTIVEAGVEPFVLNVEDITVNAGASNVCVDITVENFTDIIAMQFVITWDGGILDNATPSNFNLAGLNGSSFNIVDDCATMSWNGNDGINVADGTAIFSMCFDATEDCPTSSDVNIVSKGPTDIQIVDGNLQELTNVDINAGSIEVTCDTDPVCNIVSTDRTCVGLSGGNIIVSVEPDDNCTYSWTNSSGSIVGSNKNLLGVPAGTYTLVVTCDGTEACSLMATVENYAEMDIDGDVTNAGCGDPGAIDVTVSLGSGNYTYSWNPDQGDTPNISNLDPGTFELTVTDDDTGCTATASYSVVNEVEDLEISASSVVDESCSGDDGSITLTLNGGCEPYTIVWSDAGLSGPILNNLSEGNYSVTITDSSSPQMMTTGSFTVEGAEPLAQVGVETIMHTTGNDGSISIEITGGSPNYNYNWEGPTTGLPNNNTITGLEAGDYNVTVTDSKGCSLELGPFTVIEITVGDEPVLADVGAVNNANGFGVMCNGDSNGVITGSLTGGAFPVTIELSGDATGTLTLNDHGNFMFDELSAGTYTITASNEHGTVSEQDIEIVEPDALEMDISKGCDNDEQCDGFIDVDVSGGFGDITYDWGNPDLSGASLDDLCEGTYAVLVSDENGCQLMESVEVESCNGPTEDPCYEVRDVITPNGDGMNDQFAVSCINDFPATLEVYDRWGKLVFNMDAYDGSWMGVSNSNEELMEGGYMYIINIDFGEGRREIMKGTLTILRD